MICDDQAYDHWRPRVALARVVHPVKLGEPGAPTRAMARSKRWRRVGRSWAVPADVPLTPEQRAAEAFAVMPTGSLVTGWAALRLMGVGFMTGEGGWRPPVVGHASPSARGMTPIGLPVPAPTDLSLLQPVQVVLPPGVDSRDRPGIVVKRSTRQLDSRQLQGVACTRTARAVVDEVLLAPDWRRGVEIIDLALTATVTSLADLSQEAAQGHQRRGMSQLRAALAHARPGAESPPETWLRLVVTVDAGLPAPLVNCRVFDATGRFLARPDLFDPDRGVAIEYDGAAHRDRARHRRDTDRIAALRAVGIEVVTIVAGTPAAHVSERVRAAYGRAGDRRTGGWVVR